MNKDLKHVTRSAEVRMGDGDRTVVFRASTPAVDRHGTIVRPEGIRTEKFAANPIFVWAHDAYGGWETPSPESVIGRVVSWDRSPEAFDITVEFAPEEANPKAEQALRLVKAGFLNAVSIGFVPLKYHEEKESESEPTRLVYDEVELLEVSLVPIPSNPEAVALIRSMAKQAEADVYNGTKEDPPHERADAGPSEGDKLKAALRAARLRIASELEAQRIQRNLRGE